MLRAFVNFVNTPSLDGGIMLKPRPSFVLFFFPSLILFFLIFPAPPTHPRRDDSFHNNLWNEPNFDRIHFTGQYH